MYIRITTISYDPAKEQELLRFTAEQFIPALRQIPGFQSYTSGLDRSKFTLATSYMTLSRSIRYSQVCVQTVVELTLSLASVGARRELADRDRSHDSLRR